MKHIYLLLILLYVSRTTGKIRDYYIAAVDQDWNYAPYGGNMVSNDTSISDIFLKGGQDRIGRIYTKVIYREFTDINYTMPIHRPHWMGMLGPLLRAEVGDEMHVHFKNLAYTSGRPFSIHPHGVLYTKANEGALYLDTTAGGNKTDDGVYPGEMYSYVWKVTPEFGPTNDDPPCIPWGYHSHVYADKDIDTGLVGLLLTCKRGALYADGTRKDISKEYIIYMDTTNENNSWMIKTNAMRCGDPAACMQNTDPEFLRSNMMSHINGYVYGNMPDLQVTVGERVIWYIISLNSGIQSVSFSGNTLIHRNHRLDTIPFLPSTFLSAEMIPAYVGNFLLYSRISENFAGGMQAFYTVNPPVNGDRQKRQATTSSPKIRQLSARGARPVHNNRRNNPARRNPGIRNRYFPQTLNRFQNSKRGTNRRNTDVRSIMNNLFSRLYSKLYPRSPLTGYSPIGSWNGDRQIPSPWRLPFPGRNRNRPQTPALGTRPQAKEPRIESRPPKPIPAPAPPFTQTRRRNPSVPRSRTRITQPRWRPRTPSQTRRPNMNPTPTTRRPNIHPSPTTRRPNIHPSPTRQTPLNRRQPDRRPQIVTTATPVKPRTRPTTTPAPILTTVLPTRPTRFRNAWRRPGQTVNINNPKAYSGNAWQRLPSDVTKTLVSSHDAGIIEILDGRVTPTQNPTTTETPGHTHASHSTEAGNVNAWNFDWTATSRAPRVAREAPNNGQSFFNSRARVYYLSIEKVTWDYGPSGKDKFNGGQLLNNSQSRLFFEQSAKRIGGKYVKVQFRQYTDHNFNQRVPRSRQNYHLGLLGPAIFAETGDDLVVVLKNNADKPFSFLPFGVTFAKSQEGFYYKDKATGQMTGRIANPNQTVTYYFTIPDVYAGPTADDAPCVTHTYQSAVNPVKDMNSGLMGPMVICQRGQLQHNAYSPVHRRTWFTSTKHIYLALLTVDENESWYLDENIERFTTSQQPINKEDNDFKESNAIHSINGLVFGNLEGINFCLYDNVVWHLMDFGGVTDMHGLYIHGQTFDEFGNNIDSKGLLPGFSSTMTSRPDTIGTWSIVCRTNSHFEGGMVALYTVNSCGHEERYFRRRNGRKYYIGAVEVEWDYAPVKRSLADGEELTNVTQPGGVFVVNTEMFIGSKYKKAIYRQFTDDTFTTEVPRLMADQHLGIMGPFIKAEVEETLEVVFKNMASKPYSIHPQGLKYDKANEGAAYEDGSNGVRGGKSVAPGETFTYRWEVPERAGPGRNDPNCIGRMYYSSTDSVKDIYSGLFGPLVVCREGLLDTTGKRTDVDREFAIMFMVLDENRSHYLKDNIQTYVPMFADMNINLNNMPMDHSHMHSNPIADVIEQLNLNKSAPAGTPPPITNTTPRDYGTTPSDLLSNIYDPGFSQPTSVENRNRITDRGGIRDSGISLTNNIFNQPRATMLSNNTDNLPYMDYGPMWNDISSGKGPGRLLQRIMMKRDVAYTNSSSINFKASDPFLGVSLARNKSTSITKIDTHAAQSNLTEHSLPLVVSLKERTEASSVVNNGSSVNKVKSRRRRDQGNGNTATAEIKDPVLQGSALFQHSNHMNSINGRLMGNLNGIEMNQGDRVAWYVLALGSAEDYHPVHIHGQVFTRRSDRAHGSDVVEVFPSTSDTVEMLAVNPGNWILHCHFSKHAINGMQLIYTVNPVNK